MLSRGHPLAEEIDEGIEGDTRIPNPICALAFLTYSFCIETPPQTYRHTPKAVVTSHRRQRELSRLGTLKQCVFP
jgi:hypothetical protein